MCVGCFVFVFFFNDTATTEIYTLSLHDALPISGDSGVSAKWFGHSRQLMLACPAGGSGESNRWFRHTRQVVLVSLTHGSGDRKSTRLNSSHANISYAVFCLKKKKTIIPSHY